MFATLPDMSVLQMDMSGGLSNMSIHLLMRYKRYESNKTLFLLTPSVFKTKVIAGYEARRTCEVLRKVGMLQRRASHNGWAVNDGKEIGQVIECGYKPKFQTAPL